MSIIWSQKDKRVSLLLAIVLQVKLALSLMIFYQILWNSLMMFRSFDQPLQSIVGDFNARSKSWWSGDSSAIEFTRLDFLVPIHGFHLLISEPTHIWRNSLSCIDLISTDQPSLVVDSGVHHKLDENCHHQITFYKLDLKTVYPPPYESLVWDFKRADVNAITTGINQVDRKFIFSCKNVHQQVNIFSKTIVNIFSDFIQN